MTTDDIKQLIEKQLSPAAVEVSSSDNVHFAATVIAECFSGKTPVKRQQMVYEALGNLIIDGTIHALSLTTKVPNE